jgi:hypothetical protein
MLHYEQPSHVGTTGRNIKANLSYGVQTHLVLCLNPDHVMNVCLHLFLISFKPCITIISLKFGSSEGLVDENSQNVAMQSYM